MSSSHSSTSHSSTSHNSVAASLGTRWLGVGLSAALAVVTLSLAITGRLGLYINPDSTWFAVSMSILLLVGAAASFALPLGEEADHGHDHGTSTPEPGHQHEHDHNHDHDHAHVPTRPGTIFAAVSGGVLASSVALGALVLPPASLSAELAMSRDTGTPPLFAGADVVALATSGDTSKFGVGDWASAFATATNTAAFEGDEVTLTGFVTPASDSSDFQLTRLVITHCVIDAQPASLPIVSTDAALDTGQWVTITGTIRADADGSLVVAASDVAKIDEPGDPYEF